MRSIPVFVVLLVLLTSAASGTGWVGQQMVNYPNGDTSDQQPCIAFDSGGRPWVVWIRNSGRMDTTMFYSRWDGSRWEPERGVSGNAPNTEFRTMPTLCFDSRSRAWLIWSNHNADNSTDIASAFWTDTCWSPEIQVNLPDSTELNYAPKVACGGGQVWCVWYGGTTDVSPYSVFASRWSDYLCAWEPEMQVSPPDGNYHWWCDVAVDANGTPHAVWCELDATDNYPFFINYSYYDGHQWAGPIRVNDTARVCAAPWAAPRIVTDREGTMHVCYTGVAVGATGRDIFYSRNDSSGWTPSVRVTQDTAYNYNEWYSDIAADRQDNVWVVWDRQDKDLDQFRVYAAHFDSRLWSSEQRLDDDMTYRDQGPSLALGAGYLPWVVWTGVASQSYYDIYYNRYPSEGVTDRGDMPSSPVIAPSVSLLGRGCMVRYELPSRARVSLRVYDLTGRLVSYLVESEQKAGTHTAIWDGTDSRGRAVSAGVYLYRLLVGESEMVSKLVLVRN